MGEGEGKGRGILLQTLYTDLHTQGFSTQYFLQIMTSALYHGNKN